MTLHTRVAVGPPATTADARGVFDFLRALLGAGPDVPVEVGPKGAHSPGVLEITHPPGVGLDAWLWVCHGADGPLPVHVCDRFCAKLGDEWGSDQAAVDEHDRDIAADPTANGWAILEVNLDTTYGYRGVNGESCSDLHARLVTALGGYLARAGLPWRWYDEYAGEWHEPDDGALERFGDAHRMTGAGAWFDGPVRALIESMGGEVA